MRVSQIVITWITENIISSNYFTKLVKGSYYTNYKKFFSTITDEIFSNFIHTIWKRTRAYKTTCVRVQFSIVKSSVKGSVKFNFNCGTSDSLCIVPIEVPLSTKPREFSNFSQENWTIGSEWSKLSRVQLPLGVVFIP